MGIKPREDTDDWLTEEVDEFLESGLMGETGGTCSDDMLVWVVLTPLQEDVVLLLLLLSVLLLRLSRLWRFCFLRRASGAVATSCRRKPLRVAAWNAVMVVLIWSWTVVELTDRMPGRENERERERVRETE